MSEYHDRHTISRLIGAAPGYVGFEEGGQLTEAVRRRPYGMYFVFVCEESHLIRLSSGHSFGRDGEGPQGCRNDFASNP